MKSINYKSRDGLIHGVIVTLTALVGCTSDSTGPLPPAVSEGPLVLSAEIDRWDDSKFELSYTLQNTTDETFAVFDDAPGACLALNGNRLRLFKGKFNLGPNFLSTAPITIQGRYSMARDELTGIAIGAVPFSQRESYNGGLRSISPRSPEELEFCVGYLNVNELRVVPSDAEFALSSAPFDQEFSCIGVKRSDAPEAQSFTSDEPVSVSVTILGVKNDVLDFL